MNSAIEALRQKRDAKALIELFSSSDGDEAIKALEQISDSSTVDLWIDFLKRKEDFIRREEARYREIWRGDPMGVDINYRDAANASYLGAQFSAIRVLGRVRTPRAMSYLKKLSWCDADSDVRSDAAAALKGA